MNQVKKDKRKKIRFSIRKRISGTSERPRLAVFRSNKQIYAQVIDDTSGTTLASASSLLLKDKERKEPKLAQAKIVGNMIADNAKKSGVEKVVFDRGGFLYHGRIKSLADGARESGLIF
jgi:large subunit ribosomal protein L18